MKKFAVFLMTAVFLIGTIGLNVSVHYCHGSVVQMGVNGLHFTTAEGRMMAGCCESDGCPACKTVHVDYHIQSQFSQGQSVSLQPSQSLSDWFHGFMPVMGLCAQLFGTIDGADDDEAVFYDSDPPIADPFLPHSGLRAPPVV